MKKTDLISPGYVEEQKRLHAQPEGYGGKGGKWAGPFAQLVLSINGSHRNVSALDFGCGQGSMRLALEKIAPEIFVTEYDPAIPGKDGKPSPADWVICTDVFEHFEPELLEANLAFLESLAPRLYVVISLVETAKTLSDGRQAHILLQSREWWVRELEKRWRVSELTVSNPKPEKQAIFYLSKP